MDVFISYKSEDYGKADWVRSVLKANGISCWMAPESIPGSTSYSTEIPKAIKKCKKFVLILTEKVQKSAWVPKEIDGAVNAEKTIIPFAWEDCPLTDEFKFFLANVQIIPAFKDRKQAAESLVRLIKPEIETVVFPDNKPHNDKKKEDGNETIPDETTDGRAAVKKPAENKAVRTALKKPSGGKAGEKKKAKPLDKKSVVRLLIIMAVIFVISAVVIFALNGRNIPSLKPGSTETVAVAGKLIEKGSSSVTIKDVTITKEDIQALSQFTDIRYLYVKNCTVPSELLDSLCHYAKSTLEISNCGLTNDSLKTIRFSDLSLTTLILNDNAELSDLSAIAPLSDTVTDLRFENCNVSDVSVLKDFQSLYRITANNNKIKDISALSGNKKLSYVQFNDNELTSLDALQGSKKLHTVEVSGNKLESLSALEESIELEKIIAADNAIADLSGLNNATILKTVDLSKNKISDISVLAKSSKTLEELNVSENNIEDISALKDCLLLKTLDISGNRVTNLDALKKCEILTTLLASDNAIENIDGLSTLYSLSVLDLSKNKISSTQALNSFKSDYGAKVNLSDNRITDLKLPSGPYKELYLYGNQIEKIEPLEFVSSAKIVIDYSDKIDFSSLASWNSGYIYILDCPLDKQLETKDIIKTINSLITVEFFTTEEFLQQTQ